MIKDDDDLKTHIDYIHYNPIKHGLAANLEDWPWSTYHKYYRNGYYDNNQLIVPLDDEFAAGE
ncbi:MAG: hypothetical protein H8E46_05585 [FCB group bacterium]|nr:hypothetical protein [FCB group bacterium]